MGRAVSTDLAREEEQTRFYWSRELMRCEDSFEYLASRHLRIKAKHVIGYPPLAFNPVQVLLQTKMRDQWKRTGHVRQIWGKVRQVGASTLARALSFHNTAFKKNRNAFLAAHDEEAVYELFETTDKDGLLR